LSALKNPSISRRKLSEDKQLGKEGKACAQADEIKMPGNI
jgi:hypothetical protein